MDYLTNKFAFLLCWAWLSGFGAFAQSPYDTIYLPQLPDGKLASVAFTPQGDSICYFNGKKVILYDVAKKKILKEVTIDMKLLKGIKFISSMMLSQHSFGLMLYTYDTQSYINKQTFLWLFNKDLTIKRQQTLYTSFPITYTEVIRYNWFIENKLTNNLQLFGRNRMNTLRGDSLVWQDNLWNRFGVQVDIATGIKYYSSYSSDSSVCNTQQAILNESHECVHNVPQDGIKEIISFNVYDNKMIIYYHLSKKVIYYDCKKKISKKLYNGIMGGTLLKNCIYYNCLSEGNYVIRYKLGL